MMKYYVAIKVIGLGKPDKRIWTDASFQLSGIIIIAWVRTRIRADPSMPTLAWYQPYHNYHTL
jgi:hypothetical protein